MKLPIGKIARFALHHIVIPALGKAIADRENPLTKDEAKDAIEAALLREAQRRVRRGSCGQDSKPAAGLRSGRTTESNRRLAGLLSEFSLTPMSYILHPSVMRVHPRRRSYAPPRITCTENWEGVCSGSCGAYTAWDRDLAQTGPVMYRAPHHGRRMDWAQPVAPPYPLSLCANLRARSA